MEELKLEGHLNLKTMVVEGDFLKIIKNSTILEEKRERSIPIISIGGFEIKKPTETVNGYIQVQLFHDEIEYTSGVFSPVNDKNTVVFSGEENYCIACKIREFVDNYKLDKKL